MMPIRLLLVEDHPMTLMGLRLMLERAAPDWAIVGEATTGLEALQRLQDDPVDVVLMDIGLPEMDGIEATQVLKSRHPEVKVLMLTSKDQEADVLAALAAGADAYCMKGIGPERLVEAIAAVRDGAAWLDPAVARLVLGRLQTPTPSRQPQPPEPTEPCPLTTRELEVLHLIVAGKSNEAIAQDLSITKATAKAHVHSILQKLCVDDRTQAAVLAMRQGYVRT